MKFKRANKQWKLKHQTTINTKKHRYHQLWKISKLYNRMGKRLSKAFLNWRSEDRSAWKRRQG